MGSGSSAQYQVTAEEALDCRFSSTNGCTWEVSIVSILGLLQSSKTSKVNPNFLEVEMIGSLDFLFNKHMPLMEGKRREEKRRDETRREEKRRQEEEGKEELF